MSELNNLEKLDENIIKHAQLFLASVDDISKIGSYATDVICKNTIMTYMTEKIEPCLKSNLPSSVLYTDFMSWCKKNNVDKKIIDHLSNIIFNKYFSNYHESKRISSGAVWKNIEVRDVSNSGHGSGQLLSLVCDMDPDVLSKIKLGEKNVEELFNYKYAKSFNCEPLDKSLSWTYDNILADFIHPLKLIINGATHINPAVLGGGTYIEPVHIGAFKSIRVYIHTSGVFDVAKYDVPELIDETYDSSKYKIGDFCDPHKYMVSEIQLNKLGNKIKIKNNKIIIDISCLPNLYNIYHDKKVLSRKVLSQTIELIKSDIENDFLDFPYTGEIIYETYSLDRISRRKLFSGPVYTSYFPMIAETHINVLKGIFEYRIRSSQSEEIHGLPCMGFYVEFLSKKISESINSIKIVINGIDFQLWNSSHIEHIATFITDNMIYLPINNNLVLNDPIKYDNCFLNLKRIDTVQFVINSKVSDKVIVSLNNYNPIFYTSTKYLNCFGKKLNPFL
jgi:hypothetical protein